ncbi:MAG: Lrp/AsnC family transcriptional regulator [Proteobacteria bacterium]|nr:Lrp/AsnC family transcriptional regulator [Pseudomonadota bacterium]
MIEITKTDRRLLAELRTNGRASLTELAAATQISRATVKTRLERLIAGGVIRRFTVETDLDDRDGVRAITTVELQGSMSRAVIRSLRKIPEITSLHSTNGKWDLVAEIRTDNLREIDRILRQIREISGVLNSETSLLLDVA